MHYSISTTRYIGGGFFQFSRTPIFRLDVSRRRRKAEGKSRTRKRGVSRSANIQRSENARIDMHSYVSQCARSRRVEILFLLPTFVSEGKSRNDEKGVDLSA